jgi:hypothetical protein
LEVRLDKVHNELKLLAQMTAKTPTGEPLTGVVQEIRQKVQTLNY